jgi:UDP-3-O-[3-hydroxymyristoyl] glucosamine N-acyltransferase
MSQTSIPILVSEIERFAEEIEMKVLWKSISIKSVHSFVSINETSQNSLAYLSRIENLQKPISELQGMILFPKEILANDLLEHLLCNYMVVDDPRYLFAYTYLKFNPSESRNLFLTSYFESELDFPDSCHISPDARFGQNITIGERANIYGGVHIHDNTHIGNDVVIKPNSVIGGDGFGYAVRPGYPPVKIPHFGGVSLGNNVHIGSGTNIDQGTHRPTIISDDVKIDNGVHIAHNVNVGERSLIIAHAEISGSVIIGKDVWVAPNTSIREKLVIGDRAFIGIGSVVTKNVPAGVTVFGSPARAINSQR